MKTISFDLTSAQHQVLEAMIRRYEAEINRILGRSERVDERAFFCTLLQQHAQATGQVWPEENAGPALVKWVEKHGFAARLLDDDMILVSLQNRAITVEEVERECHLQSRCLRQRDQEVLLLVQPPEE